MPHDSSKRIPCHNFSTNILSVEMLRGLYNVLFTCDPVAKGDKSTYTISRRTKNEFVFKGIISDGLYSVKMSRITSIVPEIKSKDECSSCLHLLLGNHILYEDKLTIEKHKRSVKSVLTDFLKLRSFTLLC